MRRLLSAAVVLGVVAGSALPAQASAGPRPLQRLAAAQTRQLFHYYNGQPQTASPATCDISRRNRPLELLPTLSFASGDESFTCHTSAFAALVDLGGFIVTEDARGDTWTLADGEVVTFSRPNLKRICDDVVRFLPASASATLDGSNITAAQVTTSVFTVPVNPGADNTPGSPYFQDSVDLGHPGTLAACYSGYKALVPLRAGAHDLQVDLSAFTGAPTTFVYTLHVRRFHGHR